MNYKKLIGIFLVAGGIALLSCSYYIRSQVASGKIEISSAQQKVDMGKEILSVNPAGKMAGNIVTAPAQGKINQGNRDVAKYEKMVEWLQISGIICIILGIGVFFFFRNK